jgi:hypothetical protein
VMPWRSAFMLERFLPASVLDPDQWCFPLDQNYGDKA